MNKNFFYWLLIFFVFFTLSFSVYADIFIVQTNIFTDGSETETTTEKIYLKPNMFAVDSGDGNFFIIDSSENIITVVDNNEKVYYIMKTDEFEESFGDIMAGIGNSISEYESAIEEAIKNMPPEARAEYEKMMKENMDDTETIGPEDYKATGKTARIAGYETEQYVAEAADGSKSELWMTKALDTPELEGFIAIMGHLGTVMDHSGGNTAYTFGFPLKTVDTDGSYINTSEVSSISKEAIPSSVFAIPDGYRKIDFDSLMQGKE